MKINVLIKLKCNHCQFWYHALGAYAKSVYLVFRGSGVRKQVVFTFFMNHLQLLPNQLPCSLVDCTSSVFGPSSQNISNTCFSKFEAGVCTSPPTRSLPPSLEEEECQEHCRADKGCLFYSLSPTACSLHSTCPPRRRPCPGCRSGPKRPRLNKAQIQAWCLPSAPAMLKLNCKRFFSRREYIRIGREVKVHWYIQLNSGTFLCLSMVHAVKSDLNFTDIIHRKN